MMVESSGPGKHSLRKCNTIALADLGDTEGFDELGTENTLYALLLEEGVYKRKEVKFAAPTPAFEDLNNVDIAGTIANTRYSLLLNEDGQWGMIESVDWLIDIKLKPPYLMTGKSNVVKKIVNSGILLASYIPSKRKSVLVSPLSIKPGYILASRPSVKNVALDLVTEFTAIFEDLKDLPSGSTVYLEVLLGDAPVEFLTVLKGLRLKWLKKHERQLCGIFIQMEDTTGTVRFAGLPDVQAQAGKISLTKIFLPYNIHPRKLMFTPKKLSVAQLKLIANTI